MNNAALRFRPLWLLLGWLLVFTIVYESLTPRPVELAIVQGDKVLHAAAYLALMWWFASIYEDPRGRMTCAAGCVALGVALEFAQLLTATRTFELADIAAGTVGVAIGLACAPPRLPNGLRLLERLLLEFRTK